VKETCPRFSVRRGGGAKPALLAPKGKSRAHEWWMVLGNTVVAAITVP